MRLFGKHALVYALSTMLTAPLNLLASAVAADPTMTIYQNGSIYTMTETPAEAKNAKNAKKVEAVLVDNTRAILL